MPVSRQCYYCGRKFITSTYGMWEHIENSCEAYKLYLKDNNIINIKNFDTKEPYITNKFYLEDLTESRGIIHKNKEEYTNLLLKKKRLSMSLKL